MYAAPARRGSGSRNEQHSYVPRSIAAEDPLLLGRGSRPALRRRRLAVVIGFVGVGLGAPELEVAMGTHSSAPKVAFAIHVDLVEARAVIPARLLPQLDLVAFGGGSLIEVLYFVADAMYTAVVGELEDVLLFVVREMATVSVGRITRRRSPMTTAPRWTISARP